MTTPADTAPAPFTRRGLLATSLGALTLTALPGCAPQGGAASTGDRTAVAPPAHKPWTGITPDLPGTPDGVDGGLLTYPQQRIQLHDSPAGTGEEVTFFTDVPGSVITAERNRLWQEWNKQLGIKLAIVGAPSGEYLDKLAVTLAGGDKLADVVRLGYKQVPRIGQLLERRFTDLSEYLSGDKVHEYPALANLRADTWRGAMFNGRIYGIPHSDSTMGTVLCANKKLLTQRGLGTILDSPDDLRQWAKELTGGGRQFAFGDPLALLNVLLETFHAPNIWQVNQDGSFTHAYEAEAYLQTLDLLRQLWSDGVFHPEAFAASGDNQSEWILHEVVAAQATSIGGWDGTHNRARRAKVEIDLVGLRAPALNGRPSRKLLAHGIQTIAGIPTADPERVRLLLRVLDWFASPVGTEEALLFEHGIEGYSFTMVNGWPVRTEQGANEATIRPTGIAEPPRLIRFAGFPEETRQFHELEQQAIPSGVKDPSVGLYSETDLSTGVSLVSPMTDTQREIIQGRKPVTAWTDAVASWRSKAGDRIREEYEKAHAQQ